MAQVFRDVSIQVGFGTQPTIILGQALNVATENDISRLVMTFPASYADYTKLLDISYISASEVATVETYNLNYDSGLGKYVFIIDRKFTYNKNINIQFRARYTDGQETVDPSVLKFTFKRAIKMNDLDVLDSDPTDSMSVTLQNMVDAHAVLQCSTEVSGHVKVDGTTITETNGVISATSSIEELCIEFVMDGGDSAITTGSKGYLEIPFNSTITGWTLLADVSGNAVMDVKKCTYVNFPTTVSIAGIELPTLTSARVNQDTSLSTWTTTLNKGDILEFVVNSADNATKMTISIRAIHT